MKRELIIKTLREGGKIHNHILVNREGVPFSGKRTRVTPKQIEAVIRTTEAKLTVGYDNTRTVKL